MKKPHVGNTCIPDELLRDGITWDGDAQARLDDKKYAKACHELDCRWRRWNKAKRRIETDWKRNAEKQLLEVTDSVELGLLLNHLDDEREANEKADALAVENYLNQLAALIARRKSS